MYYEWEWKRGKAPFSGVHTTLHRSAPESNFSTSGISFPRISWPKTRLPSLNHAKQTALVYRHACGGSRWEKKRKRKRLNGLLCSSKADRCCSLLVVDGWTDGQTSWVLSTQTASREECASVQQPTQAESCGFGLKGQERGGSSGARVSGCCFNPDENSASAMYQWSR